jgi:hypothetical protein
VEITLPEGTPWYGWVTVLLGAVLVAFSPVIVSMVRKARRTEETVNSVHEQVANTHNTNLREDLDLVIKGIDRLQEQVVHATSKIEVTSTAVQYLTEDARRTARDLAEMRVDRRSDSEKIDRVGEQLTAHITKDKE